MNDLYCQALDLPAEQRGELAILLLESLPDHGDAPIRIDADYAAELRRRLEELDSGRAKKDTLENVMARLRDPARRRSLR
jgi:putative addiction module component (TIGR02574 family)